MNREQQMLKEISMVDFVLVELMLYLDTHPLDRNAMEHFNHYSRIRNHMTREFSMKYYPLTKEMAESSREWRWGAAPLPWEIPGSREGGCA